MTLNILDFGNVCFGLFFIAIFEHQWPRATTPWGTRKWTTLGASKKPSRPRNHTIGPQGVVWFGNPKWGRLHDFEHARFWKRVFRFFVYWDFVTPMVKSNDSLGAENCNF